MQPLHFFAVLAFCLISLLSREAMAGLDAPPPFSISPTVNGMNISYFTHQDRLKLILYIINHEKYPVTCDAQYESGPEKQDKPEQSIDPEKGIKFNFVYGRNGTKIHVDFVCIKQLPENH